MKLDPTTGVPFYRQVEASLSEQIRTGRLPAGTMLLSARLQAEALLVSVITIKQAYDALEAGGLVYSQQGRGTFVAERGAEAARENVRAELLRALAIACEQARSRGVEERELRSLILTFLEKP